MSSSSVEREPVTGFVREGPTTLVSALRRLWRLFVDGYHDIESSMWGRLLLTNVWPAYLFSLPFGTRVVNVYSKIVSGPPSTEPDTLFHFRISLAQEMVTLVFMFLVVLLFTIRRPLKGPHATWRGAVVALIGTFLLSFVGFLPVPSDTSTTALMASTVVVLAGTVFTIWSLATLGRCFGMFPEARGLVTRGPYRWVRHPVYLGEMVSAFGIVITKFHPAIIALYVAFVGFQYWRAVLEERALAAAFPAEYPSYRARTGRLFPRWG